MEQKLALLRQQKQEQMDFEKSLQQQRLETLQSKRSEYEQKLQAQREKERQVLIAQEKQILQQQFGSNGMQAAQPAPVAPVPTSMVGGAHQYMAPPPTTSYNPSSMQFQSLSLHDPTQAGPLPQKLDHALGLDQSAPPPPYHPSTYQQMAAPPLSLPTDSVASSFNPYQQPPPQASYQPQFTQHQQPGSGMTSVNPLPPSSFSTAASLHPPHQLGDGQPHSLESVLSVPPLGGGGQPSSLPPQLGSGLPPPQGEPPQHQYQQGFMAAPSQPMGGAAPPPQMGYQQQPAAYPSGPRQPTGIPPPGVSYQAPPPTQQFGGAPMQMNTGGFIPNGAHQGQAPPQPHPQPVGRPRQESQPPLISFD